MNESWVECGEWEMVPVCGLNLQPRPGIPPGGKACVVCGKVFVPARASRQVCGVPCGKERDRRHRLERYANDPEYRHAEQKRCLARNKKRWANDPEYRKRRMSPASYEKLLAYKRTPKYRKRERELVRQKHLQRDLIEATKILGGLNEP